MVMVSFECGITKTNEFKNTYYDSEEYANLCFGYGLRIIFMVWSLLDQCMYGIALRSLVLFSANSRVIRDPNFTKEEVQLLQ